MDKHSYAQEFDLLVDLLLEDGYDGDSLKQMLKHPPAKPYVEQPRVATIEDYISDMVECYHGARFSPADAARHIQGRLSAQTRAKALVSTPPMGAKLNAKLV